jgi:hypothetical protein
MKDNFYKEVENAFNQFLKYHMKILLRGRFQRKSREGRYFPTYNRE